MTGSRTGRRGRGASLAAALAIGVALTACAGPTDPPATSGEYAALPKGFHRGVNLEPIRGFGRTMDVDRLPAALDELSRLSIDHVAIIPSFFQVRLGDTAFVWRGGRPTVEEETRAAIRAAHDRGLAVLLKPHLWLEDRASGAWRGDIDPDDAAWEAWSAEYRDAVLGFARLGAEESVAGISIGSELRDLTASRPAFWVELARQVREVFPGDVTYAANWHEEFDRIDFWPELDYVGVDAFWPLVDSPDAVLDASACDARMGSIRDALAAVAERSGRPVLLTEIGYKSARGALWQPWEWEGAEVDLEAQRTAWDCIARVLGDAVPADRTSAAWLQGLYAWNWHTDPRLGGPLDTDFTLRNKPAEDILGAWFRAR